ncbi:unnamed protein product [Cyprideis torosa]|uniref:Adipocyte plasma membrane-associated protein n=1 Tax=Cyprideis torosa TaxID=163714 RepID=A0A7R8WEJ2_9CRUS|nr:unnamed protein product [Cyprideis torosa]CAG0895851.1 unnamed protein product [Cyprideis torosa]
MDDTLFSATLHILALCFLVHWIARGSLFKSFVAFNLALLLLPVFPPTGLEFEKIEIKTEEPVIDKSLIRPFKSLRVLLKSELPGPESIVFTENGNVITGLEDGRVVKFDPRSDSSPGTIVRTGTDCTNKFICPPDVGRPVGIRLDKSGTHAILADAYRGILRVSLRDGKVETIISMDDMIDDRPAKFPDDCDIGRDGTIYWSDAAGMSTLNNLFIELLSDGYGRLIATNPKTKTSRVLVTNIRFANGVQLTSDESAVLVVETGNFRILKYHLKGPKNGTVEVFADTPFAPDNIRPNGRGGYLVGQVTRPDPGNIDIFRFVSSSTYLRRYLARFLYVIDVALNVVGQFFPNSYAFHVAQEQLVNGGQLLGSRMYGSALELNDDGSIVALYEGLGYPMVSQAYWQDSFTDIPDAERCLSDVAKEPNSQSQFTVGKSILRKFIQVVLSRRSPGFLEGENNVFIQNLEPQDIFARYLNFTNNSVTNTFSTSTAVQEFLHSIAAVDSGQRLQNDLFHFDGTKIKESNAKLIELYKLIFFATQNLEEFPSDLQFLRNPLATILHGIMKFYSRSTWIEQGNKEIADVLGLPWRQSSPLLEIETDATCETTCESTSQEGFCENNVILDRKLSSGVWGKGETGQCKVGGVFDKDGSDAATGINKDSTVPCLSPHGDFHETAVDLAKRESESFLYLMRSLVGFESFENVLGLESAPPLVLVVSFRDAIRSIVRPGIQKFLDAAKEIPLLLLVHTSRSPTNTEIMVHRGRNKEEFLKEFDSLTLDNSFTYSSIAAALKNSPDGSHVLVIAREVESDGSSYDTSLKAIADLARRKRCRPVLKLKYATIMGCNEKITFQVDKTISVHFLDDGGWRENLIALARLSNGITLEKDTTATADDYEAVIRYVTMPLLPVLKLKYTKDIIGCNDNIAFQVDKTVKSIDVLAVGKRKDDNCKPFIRADGSNKSDLINLLDDRRVQVLVNIDAGTRRLLWVRIDVEHLSFGKWELSGLEFDDDYLFGTHSSPTSNHKSNGYLSLLLSTLELGGATTGYLSLLLSTLELGGATTGCLSLLLSTLELGGWVRITANSSLNFFTTDLLKEDSAHRPYWHPLTRAPFTNDGTSSLHGYVMRNKSDEVDNLLVRWRKLDDSSPTTEWSEDVEFHESSREFFVPLDSASIDSTNKEIKPLVLEGKVLGDIAMPREYCNHVPQGLSVEIQQMSPVDPSLFP